MVVRKAKLQASDNAINKKKKTLLCANRLSEMQRLWFPTNNIFEIQK